MSILSYYYSRFKIFLSISVLARVYGRKLAILTYCIGCIVGYIGKISAIVIIFLSILHDLILYWIQYFRCRIKFRPLFRTLVLLL